MAVNRYTQITPSRFNPMSLQEIMLTPHMQRQKHDNLIAQQELLRQGLAKVDPHDKYFNEAVNIKSQINNRITDQAERLAKEGINTNTTSDFIKLNREYNDLMSPTGKLGMINSHNVNLRKTYSDYLKASTDAGNSPAIAKMHADLALQQHLKDPLYDDNGRVVDFKINQGPSKYVDTVKWINDLATKVGFDKTGWSKAAGALSYDANGNRYVINNNAKGFTSDNIDRLKNLADLATRAISDPSHEVRQSIDYNFRNPQNVLNDALTQLNAYRERETNTESGYSVGSVDWANLEDKTATSPTGITEAVMTSEVNTPDTEALGSLVSDIKSTPAPGSPITDEKGLKEYLKPEQVKRYKDTYNSMVAKGELPKGNPYSMLAMDKIFKDWQRLDKIQASNNIIVPSSKDNDILASPNLVGKDSNEKNSFIQRRLNVALNQKQKVLYDGKGKAVDLEDVDMSSVQLNGHYSPLNLLPQIGNNPNNMVSPHSITWKDKDGDTFTGYLLRDRNETQNPQYRAATVINKTFQRAVKNEGRFVTFTSSELPELRSTGLSSMRVKYDYENDTYTVEAVKNGKTVQKSQPYSKEEYQNVMYNLIK